MIVCNPVISPELALLIKEQQADMSDFVEPEIDIETHLRYECGLSIQEEPLDLASETEPSVFDKYMPNDGTPRIEHRLRKQGLRKASDSTRPEVMELYVEVWCITNKRPKRVRILRQPGGDMFI